VGSEYFGEKVRNPSGVRPPDGARYCGPRDVAAPDPEAAVMLARITTPSARRPEPKPARRTRLSVEPLEGRAVPAAFTAATVHELVAGINAANLTPEVDTISLAPGTTFTLTAADNAADGRNGLPVIAAGEDLTVVGNNDTIGRSTAAGTPAFRLFDVAAGASLTLRQLTLQGGLAVGFFDPNPDGGATAVPGRGGAVLSRGTLILEGVTVQNNVAQGDSWAVDHGYFVPGYPAYGGGVYSAGSLSLTGCTVQSNSALGSRGADGSAFRSYGEGWSGHIAGEPGGNASGGGICVAAGTAVIAESTIARNAAKGGPGGKGTHGDPTGAAGVGRGGGVFIAAGATVFLDGFTMSHVKRNSASTADDDISGTSTTL
jgi:hypothetical protein